MVPRITVNVSDKAGKSIQAVKKVNGWTTTEQVEKGLRLLHLMVNAGGAVWMKNPETGDLEKNIFL